MNPILSFVKTIGYLFMGRLKFPLSFVGEKLKMEDGQVFTVFRHVIINAPDSNPDSLPAVFKVRFKVANMTPEQNKMVYWIPIPFFIGLPGFRKKLWMINESNGYFQGLYEWSSEQDARNYASSFAMRFMSGRAIPGSVSYEIVEQASLVEYTVKRGRLL